MAAAKRPIQLELASNKLEYHIGMYVRTYEWLRARESPAFSSFLYRTYDTTVGLIARIFNAGSRVLVSNAVEESNAVHARILIDFLRHGTRPNDVNAEDYFPAANPSQSFPLPSTFLQNEKHEIERKLIHLTTTGQTQRMYQITWSRNTIARELEGELRNFLTVVPTEAISHLRSVDRTSCIGYLDRLKAALP